MTEPTDRSRSSGSNRRSFLKRNAFAGAAALGGGLNGKELFALSRKAEMKRAEDSPPGCRAIEVRCGRGNSRNRLLGAV